MENDAPILNKAECDELAQLMNHKYASLLRQRRFSIEASRLANGVRVEVALCNNDESYVYPVEARLQHTVEDMQPSDAMLFLVDYIDLYFEEFLAEDEHLFLPIDWTDYQYDAVNFQMRGQIRNLKLEKQASDFLRQAEI